MHWRAHKRTCHKEAPAGHFSRRQRLAQPVKAHKAGRRGAPGSGAAAADGGRCGYRWGQGGGEIQVQPPESEGSLGSQEGLVDLQAGVLSYVLRHE